MTPKLTVELTLKEAEILSTHLASLIAKGSISTTPSWARRIVFKIGRAAREQYPQAYREYKEESDGTNTDV